MDATTDTTTDRHELPSHLLAGLQALAARLDEQAIEINGLKAENATQAAEIARLKSAPPGASAPTSTGGAARKTGRRGVLRSLLTASAAGALLAIAKAAATVEVAHASPISGDSTTDNVAGVTGVYQSTSNHGFGVYGATSSSTDDSTGVYGRALNSPGLTYGVRGETASTTTNATGVKGEASGPGTNGIWGTNSSTSSGAVGVFGTASATSGAAIGVWGRSRGTDAGAKGVYGVIDTPGATGTGVYGQSTSGIGVYGQSTNSYGCGGATSTPGFAGLFGYAGVASAAGFLGVNGAPGGTAGYFHGAVTVDGPFQVVNGPKNALVAHPDGSHRRMYCQESPEPWFEDFGKSQLQGGRATVRLDPDFAAVSRSDDYGVFLTAGGDCKGMYIANQTPVSFEVRELQGGTSSVPFSYRLVARRKDDVGKRLEKVDLPKLAPIDVERLTRAAGPSRGEK